MQVARNMTLPDDYPDSRLEKRASSSGRTRDTRRACRHELPAVAFHVASALLCLSLLALVSGCPGDPARPEAAVLVRTVTDLREAPNPAKRGPLERLKAMPCSHSDVCDARDACVDAFEHHVRGIELGVRLRATDAASPEAPEPDDLRMQLLEMNIEIEEGQARMPLCEERVAAVRLAHKV